MSKGDDTRDRVVAQTGALMNKTGYLATPLSAILETVGLKKGGLYNHFASKEALALESFRRNVQALGAFLGPLARRSGDPWGVLWGLLEASLHVAAGTVVEGGCPVLNAGTEADDLHDPLRAAAAMALENLRQLIVIPLRPLFEAGAFKPGVEIDGLSWLLLSVVEGSILTTKVRGHDGGQRAALATLKIILETMKQPEAI